MTLKLFADLMSQPSRALYIFLKVNKIPFEFSPVALRKGEHMTDEFKAKFNRFGKVPFIHDDNFKLAESIAIVRYVARKHSIDNNWYPQDQEKQARVDEYLEWQHLNTRTYCSLYFLNKWMFPALTGTKPNPKSLKKHEENMVKCLDEIENIWLKDTPYLTGNEISVADIFGACEIEQPRVAGFEPREGRAVLSAWLERVRNETNPCYDEAHKFLNKLAQQAKQAEAKA